MQRRRDSVPGGAREGDWADVHAAAHADSKRPSIDDGDPGAGDDADQASRGGALVAAEHPLEPDLLATATAAQGFLWSRWLGAILMVYSFTHLYVFGLRPGASVRANYVVAGLFMAVGALMWWRSREYAHRLDFPWRPRWQAAADLFAYTAMVFWALFLVALWLTSRGVALF